MILILIQPNRMKSFVKIAIANTRDLRLVALMRQRQ